MIWDAIRAYEAKYNIYSFFRDLPTLREKTFTKRTIKHSFEKLGTWPVSFKQVKRKIKEYGRKNKNDTGLDFLEFKGDPNSSDSEAENGLLEEEPVLDPQLQEEHQLPALPRPASYSDCVFQLKELDNKIQDALSSLSRRKYNVVRETTDSFLMRGSLHEMEIINSRQSQIEIHKAKLNARLSLQKGGSLLGIDGLNKKMKVKREAAEDAVRKAKRRIVQHENKAKSKLHQRGIQARKDEKARLQFISSNRVLGARIPDDKWIPIRDPEKNPLPIETEALRAPQSMYDEVARLEHEWEQLQLNDPTLFTDVPIDPKILQLEHEFRSAQRGGLSQVLVSDESEDDREEAESDTSGSDDITPPRSVASIDSIQANADFVRIEG